jgi:signal peptidase II
MPPPVRRLGWTMKRSRTCALALLLCVVCLVGCDHATKLAAETALRDHAPLRIVPGVMDLAYTENHGVAFSALERLSLHPPAWALFALAVVATSAILALWFRRRRATWPEHAGFALVVAGALGNALDRVARGHVVDFIHVRFWPVFNVADILVVAGGMLLLLVHARRAPRSPPPHISASPP